MIRRAGLIAAALVAGATLATAHPAYADAPVKVLRVTDHYRTPAPAPVDRQCAPRPGAVSSFAVLASNAHGNDPGDTLRGTSVDAFCIYPMADESLTYEGTETFTGSLAGCGAGTVVLAAAGTITPIDPATGTRAHNGFWAVKPGTGTGGLAALKLGGGTVKSTVGADLSDDGFHTGKAVC